MNNELSIFKNEEFGEVRSLLIDNEPWFVGKDVAIALGYKDSSDALKKHSAFCRLRSEQRDVYH